ncbi:hypothetical protein OAS39_06405 [Pirellulales bacterium]|nr:hypothetical protein [Pirellulales bacterium]
MPATMTATRRRIVERATNAALRVDRETGIIRGVKIGRTTSGIGRRDWRNFASCPR